MSSFDSWLNAALRDQLSKPDHLVPPPYAEQLLIPQKLAMRIEVPNELLMDAGVIPDTRPPLPPPSRRTRFRWWRAQQRVRLARIAYRLIAGEDVPEAGWE